MASKVGGPSTSSESKAVMESEHTKPNDSLFNAALDQARAELLDLTLRNRALSMRPDANHARMIFITGGNAQQVYERLVEKERTFTFSSANDKAQRNLPDEIELFQEEAANPQETAGYEKNQSEGIPEKRRTDTRLQTNLTAEKLSKQLLAIERDARTAIEEQGTNLLFLAFGDLVWYEDEHSDIELHAPLVLVPVQLSRKPQDTGQREPPFVLSVRDGEDIFDNVSLRARLKQSFNLDIPDLDIESESFNIATYLQDVGKSIESMNRWRINADAIALGFFSFQKYLMYLDLKPERWPEEKKLFDHAIFGGLLQAGITPVPEPFSDDIPVDQLVSAERLDHVVDADSSQTIAIEKVRHHVNVVIQGPPGTGKSQSITNIIATAVLDGKSVLFVAEKKAALDVVKRRLDHEGLGPICLELHGAGQNSARMLASVMEAWSLGRPVMPDAEKAILDLNRRREILNDYPCQLHEPLAPSGLTPYQLFGKLKMLGTDGKEIPLENAEHWSMDEIEGRRALVIDFAEALKKVGNPSTNIWHGATAERLLRIDLPNIENILERTRNTLTETISAAKLYSTAINQNPSWTLAHLAEQLIIGETLLAAPVWMDWTRIHSPTWETGRTEIIKTLANVRDLTLYQAFVQGKVREEAYDRDWTEERRVLLEKAHSPFKLFSAKYRQARTAVKTALTNAAPKHGTKRIEILDKLIAIQRLKKALLADEHVARQAFGNLWNGDQTDWQKAEAVLNWVVASEQTGLGQDFRDLAATKPNLTTIATTHTQLVNARDAFLVEAGGLADILKLDWNVAFTHPLELVSFEQLASRTEIWRAKLNDLPAWCTYIGQMRELINNGIEQMANECHQGRLDFSNIEPSFWRSLYTTLIRKALRERPILARFDGSRHTREIDSFREADRHRRNVARHRVLSAHYAKIPRVGEDFGDIGFLRGEAERKRNRKSIRTILRRAGTLVQHIKPVFLMSPLSVAQYVEPGALDFDLLVIDEASQIRPVDALGAIARARQIVVVGDSNQLPPTTFFTRMTSSSDDKDDEEEGRVDANTANTFPVTAAARDMESILSLCVARGIPETMLRWHYRSRHHSLIAISNSEFYQNRLFVVPNPYKTGHGELGVRFHKVDPGGYDRARSRTNRLEAGKVAEAIRTHAHECPNLSLGVATFSTAQRDAILDTLELLRMDDPILDEFILRDTHECFFVKNLESVQGDERDVVFISVGYGRDASGYMSNSFGPINGDHGARRLNVLFSRAKMRCEVFSSITDEDVETQQNAPRGVVVLKRFLRFARNGIMDIPRHSGREEDSPFETAVCNTLRDMNYEVDAQVGQSGFFIDLAVIDPNQPGRYLLGVECDGATYHSSRCARERDRLRQYVLEDQGWLIHRIWSTDWFHNPDEEKEKLARKLESLCQQSNLDAAVPRPQSVAKALPIGSARDSQNIDGLSGIEKLATPYVQAKGSFCFGTDEMMKRAIGEVLKIEAPIHVAELQNRCRELSGLSRVTNGFLQQFLRTLRSVENDKKTSRCDDFIHLINDEPVPRNRENVASPELRKPTMIAPMEYDAAIKRFIEYVHGATMSEIAPAIARMLGFKSTSQQLRSIVDKRCLQLVQQGVIHSDADGVTRLCTKELNNEPQVQLHPSQPK